MNQVKWACDDAFVLVNYVLCFFYSVAFALFSSFVFDSVLEVQVSFPGDFDMTYAPN